MTTLEKLGINESADINTLQELMEAMSFKLESLDVTNVSFSARNLIEKKPSTSLLDVTADVAFSCNDNLTVDMKLSFEHMPVNGTDIVTSFDKETAIKIIETSEFDCHFGINEIPDYNSDGTVNAEFRTTHQDISNLVTKHATFSEQWTSHNRSEPDIYNANLMYMSGGLVQQHFATLVDANTESELGQQVLDMMRKKAIEALSK